MASREKTPVARYPLHTLSAILTFSYPGASPALMGACAQQGISLSLLYAPGKVSGPGLRRSQRKCCCAVPSTGRQIHPSQSCAIARAMVFGKVYNARWSIERTCRDHGLRVDDQRLGAASGQLKALLPSAFAGDRPGQPAGLEGPGPPPISVCSTS